MTASNDETMTNDQPEGQRAVVCIPRELIRRRGLTAGAVHTWLWLRCLWLEGGPGGAFSMEELARLSGKSQATLYEHLRRLKEAGALRWVQAGKGRLRVIFEGEGEAEGHGEAGKGEGESGVDNSRPRAPKSETQILGARKSEIQISGVQKSGIQKTGIQKAGNAPSLNTESLINFNHDEDFKREGKFRKSGGQESENPEGEAGAAPCGASPEAITRAFTGRRPNQAQRRLLNERVRDLGRWRETLTHWLAHGWNPTNLAGMLELYERGGAGACRYCGEGKGVKPGKPKGRDDPFEELLSEIQRKRGEGGGGAQ